MKKTLLAILLSISLIKLDAIKIKELEEGKYLLTIDKDTIINEYIKIDGDLFIIGKDNINTNKLITTHEYPTLMFDDDSKIIATGAIFLKNINIKNEKKLKYNMLISIP
jgi:hypothetical protein